MGDNAIWRLIGCTIAVLAAGGCEQLFQVAGAPHDDASAVGGDVLPPGDVTPDGANMHDEDHDGVYDPDDNCPSDAQPGGDAGQGDIDHDGIGDACDPWMTTQQSFQFFDPLVTLAPDTWTTMASTWVEDGSGDAIVSESTPAFAERPIALGSGTAEVWVADPPSDFVTGLVWGVLFPADSSSAPAAGTSAGCVLERYPDGTDHVGVSTGFTTVDAGVLPPGTNPGPIRIMASLDFTDTVISCAVLRLADPTTVITGSSKFTVGGPYLALFASDPGLTFNSVFYMTSPS